MLGTIGAKRVNLYVEIFVSKVYILIPTSTLLQSLAKSK